MITRYLLCARLGYKCFTRVVSFNLNSNAVGTIVVIFQMCKRRHEEVKSCLVWGRAGILTQAACPSASGHLTLHFFLIFERLLLAWEHAGGKWQNWDLNFRSVTPEPFSFIACTQWFHLNFFFCHCNWFLIHECVGLRVREGSEAWSLVDKLRKLGWQRHMSISFLNRQRRGSHTGWVCSVDRELEPGRLGWSAYFFTDIR